MHRAVLVIVQAGTTQGQIAGAAERVSCRSAHVHTVSHESVQHAEGRKRSGSSAPQTYEDEP
jgi:hypothetical protein